MYAVISPEKIEIPPGSLLQIPGTWEDYEVLSQQLGDRTIPRLKYRNGQIWFMSPLPEHGRNVSLITDTIKAILDHLGKEYEAFTPITMKLPQRSGIELDYCFYIDNWQAASGKTRIDWSTEPPPDLVVEIDIISYTWRHMKCNLDRETNGTITWDDISWKKAHKTVRNLQTRIFKATQHLINLTRKLIDIVG